MVLTMRGNNETMDEPENGLNSTTQRIDTGWGRIYVIISEDEDGDPFDVFVITGASGGLFNSQAESLGKTISTGLRMADDRGKAAEELASNLIGIRSDRVDDDNGDTIYSIPDAIGIALKRFTTGRLGQPVREEDGGDDLP